MAYLNPTAGAARAAGGVGAGGIAAGALAATTAGRAAMAALYFNAATASAKIAPGALARELLSARTVEAHTAGDTLLAAESGSVHTSVGAAGTITIVLPVSTVGLEFLFYVGAAFELRIDPAASETISLPSNGVPGGAGKYLVADAIGESVYLVCAKAGTWSVAGFTGTWTAEA